MSLPNLRIEPRNRPASQIARRLRSSLTVADLVLIRERWEDEAKVAQWYVCPKEPSSAGSDLT